MKQRQHIFQSWAIEVITVLLASTISFPVSDALDVQLSILPFIMVACYVALKLIYHLCIFLSAHIISLVSLFCHKPVQSDRQTKDDCALATAISMVGNDDIQMKRIELFHYEYLHEERQYLQQKEKEERKISITDNELKKITSLAKAEQALNLFENNFDTLKANKAVIKGDANLKVRVEILRNRFNDFIDSLD